MAKQKNKKSSSALKACVTLSALIFFTSFTILVCSLNNIYLQSPAYEVVSALGTFTDRQNLIQQQVRVKEDQHQTQEEQIELENNPINESTKPDNDISISTNNDNVGVRGGAPNVALPRLPCPKLEKDFTKTYISSIYENEDEGDIDNNRIKNLVKNMVNSKMCFSLNHQSKFFMMKDKVIAWVKSQSREKELLYGPPGRDNFAVIVNDKYAFRHIFKSGGTTVNMWTKNKHTKNEDLEGRKMLTAVRDPIDHFLSGWAECGFRSKRPDEDPSFRMDLELDQRVQNWVECVKRGTDTGVDRIPCPCSKHSFPQANFLLDLDMPESFDSKLELLGDLRELHLLMGAVGFTMDGDHPSQARDSSNNAVKVERYPRNKTLLSKETLRRICEFVILDYALFDFKLPNYCVRHIQPTLDEIMEGSE